MWRIYNRSRNCLQCWNEFTTYKSSHRKWCSKQCYYQSLRDQRPKVLCNVCWEQIQKTLYTKNRNWENYCNRDCYNKRRSENRKQNKRQSYYMQEFVKQWCIDCKEKRPYLLQIHHIDWNPTNNKDENLEVVCANCHIKRHLWNKNWVFVYWPKYYLTDRELLNTL